MKVSISWIFEHIDHDWRTVDVPALVDIFNQKTAEIEHIEKISLNLSVLALGRVTACSESGEIQLEVPEYNCVCMLPVRAGVRIDDLYLIKKQAQDYTWACMADVGGEKESLLPAVSCTQEHVAGSWKKYIEPNDYILDVDNKSITNRPDLWGHRGLAREIAALLNLPFKPLDTMVASVPVVQTDDWRVEPTQTNPFLVENKAVSACKRFATSYVPAVRAVPSSIAVAIRLSKVDSRPIDAIVDCTNYVMLELGQPLHAFDADTIAGRALVARHAKKTEKLTLLDAQTIQLCEDDLVISDEDTALGLAGVMGGAATAVSRDTQTIIVEGAWFDPGTIRRAAVRHKIRTEASARFEKNLDPNQNTQAILRFLFLLNQLGVATLAHTAVVSLGAPVQPKEIMLTHDFIEKRLGVTIDQTFVLQTLTKLGFMVTPCAGAESNGYSVLVPTYRGTKDITIKEDIVEEVGRFFGYTAIPAILPQRALSVSHHEWVYQLRAIKQYMAYVLSMRELSTYSMFDEDFLRLINWEPTHAVAIKNPISENLRRMATTLVPTMLKAVHVNSADYQQVRFFEWGRTWQLHTQVHERKALAGIVYEQKRQVDFYGVKSQLESFFAMLALPVTWHKVDTPEQPWYMPYQTADIMYDGNVIGRFGKVHPTFFAQLCEGDACVFELDGDALLQYKAPLVVFEPVPKYPDISRDISMLVPLAVTAQKVQECIAASDTAIASVQLIDFFEKEEWVQQRSLTFRFIIRDEQRTLLKQEADAVWDRVAANLKTIGAVIR